MFRLSGISWHDVITMVHESVPNGSEVMWGGIRHRGGIIVSLSIH